VVLRERGFGNAAVGKVSLTRVSEEGRNTKGRNAAVSGLPSHLGGGAPTPGGRSASTPGWEGDIRPSVGVAPRES